MDIHHLRVFVAVFDNRSFSKASKKLRLTQPTVSSHIMNLEQELGCRLFDRTGRHIIPTREAETLYLHALEVTEKLEGIADAVRGLDKEIAGDLVLGASTIPGTYILPRLTAKFREKYPRVSFEIRLGDTEKITDLVLSHDLLVGMVGAKTASGQLNYDSFAEDELIVISPPKLVSGNLVSLKQLVSLPFLLREAGSGTRKTMEKYLAMRGLSVKDFKVAAVLGSTDAIKEAVKAGLGVSVVSRFAAPDELASGRLIGAKISGISMKRDFYIVSHKKRTLPAHYRLFIEHLQQQRITAPS